MNVAQQAKLRQRRSRVEVIMPTAYQGDFDILGDETVPMTKLGNLTNEWNSRYMILGEYLDLDVACEAPNSSIMPSSPPYVRAVNWINQRRAAQMQLNKFFTHFRVQSS